MVYLTSFFLHSDQARYNVQLLNKLAFSQGRGGAKKMKQKQSLERTEKINHLCIQRDW